MRLLPAGILVWPRRCSTTSSPSRAEIAAALDDNICRCGSHLRILRAVNAPPRRCARERPHERAAAGDGASRTTRLDQWVGFPAPGRVARPGRVEIGQGVLTAMLQIAADELDVSPERIDPLTGDTEATPNEGYTAGSQSIQFGGVALRLACAEVRELFLAAARSITRREARRPRGARRRYLFRRPTDRARLLDARWSDESRGQRHRQRRAQAGRRV